MRHRAHKAFALALALVIAVPAGCGSDSGDYSRYVTLGEYRGLSATLTVEAVTDEELESYEKDQLSGYEEYEEVSGSIEQGHYVTLSLIAKDGDDVVYDFSEDGYEMTIGDEEFGSEVDEALIGKQVGDELELSVSYDEEFEDGGLCGRDIDYEITVQEIQSVTYPELTDTFIQETFGEDTLADWENVLRQELISSREADATENMREDLVDQVIAGSTIKGYPKSLYKQKQEETESEYQGYADMFGCSVEEIYDMLGADEDSRKQAALDATNRAMVLSLIREQEGLELTDADYQERLADYAADNGYDTTEELLEDYDEDSLREYFLDELTLDFLEDEADITEVTD